MISLFKSLTSYFQLRKDHFLKTNWKQFWISSKTKRFRGLDEIPSEVWKTRSFNYILFEAGNATYNQSSIEIWTRGCILPFINKVDLSLTTNYRETNPLLPRSTFQINRIQPEIEKILRQNQNGFRKNRSAACQILTVQRIIDGVRTKNLEAGFLFVDFFRTLTLCIEKKWQKF